MNTADDLSRWLEKYEAIITCHEDTATKQIEDIWSSTQPDVDAAREIIRHQEALIAQTEADREAQKQRILSITSEAIAPTRRLLADVKHQLATISAPILRLPTECIAEIMQYFNVDNSSVITLLVSKRWNTIAKATPRLWSKIVLTDANPPGFLRLKEAHICKSLEHLSFILSFAKNAPLDIELYCPNFRSGFEGVRARPPRRYPMSFPHNFWIGEDLTMGTSEIDPDWPDEALRMLGADGQSRRWRSLYITSWSGTNKDPFMAIAGPFDNLQSLYIRTFAIENATAYEPLVAAVVQGAPRLSTVDTADLCILPRMQGWRERRFWGKIESFLSLAACDDWSFLSYAANLKVLSISHWGFIQRNEPVHLPCLHTLRLQQSCPEALDGFRLPALRELFLDGTRFIHMTDAIPLLSVTSIISTDCSDVRILRHFLVPNLYHLHIEFLYYLDRRPQSTAWQKSFAETFDGSRFMPRPTSLHLELPVSENQLLSALLQLPQLEELVITPLRPLGSKFWTALKPRGASRRKKAKQYCRQLRILAVEIKPTPFLSGQPLPRARTLELATEMAVAREQDGQTLTHLLFSWDDGSKDEVLGCFKTLPLHPAHF